MTEVFLIVSDECKHGVASSLEKAKEFLRVIVNQRYIEKVNKPEKLKQDISKISYDDKAAKYLVVASTKKENIKIALSIEKFTIDDIEIWSKYSYL